MTHNYKTGDYVECIHGTTILHVGQVYKIERVSENSIYVQNDVLVDSYSPRDFKPATPPSKFKVGDVGIYRVNNSSYEARVLATDGKREKFPLIIAVSINNRTDETFYRMTADGSQCEYSPDASFSLIPPKPVYRYQAVFSPDRKLGTGSAPATWNLDKTFYEDKPYANALIGHTQMEFVDKVWTNPVFIPLDKE